MAYDGEAAVRGVMRFIFLKADGEDPLAQPTGRHGLLDGHIVHPILRRRPTDDQSQRKHVERARCVKHHRHRVLLPHGPKVQRLSRAHPLAAHGLVGHVNRHAHILAGAGTTAIVAAIVAVQPPAIVAAIVAIQPPAIAPLDVPGGTPPQSHSELTQLHHVPAQL